MSAEANPVLRFGGYILDARKRLLLGPDGHPISISSRAFDTLLYLASHPHELIDKHELMNAVWPSTVVEENNLNQQISALRKILGETPDDHRFIVTVMGRGYRFVQDVHPASVPPTGAHGLPVSTPSGTGRDRERSSLPQSDAHSDEAPFGTRSVARRHGFARAIAAGAAVVIFAAAAFLVVDAQRPDRTTSTATQSIAVLPFADLSPNEDQSYFADGLSEELLDALGELNGLRVIGRTSSFSFRGGREDARDVGAALGVRHVLEGSVRRDGDELRITARLVDAKNGAQLWAYTYDRSLGDVFAIQREIADAVANTLELTFRPVRAASAAGGTLHLEAYDAYLAARAVMNNGAPRARDAVALLERAVELDPEFALAWAALAEAYTYAVDFPATSALPLTDLEVQHLIARAALRAFELAPDAPETLRSAGMVSMQNRDWAEAERRLRKAVELAGPYDYDSNFRYAWFLMNVGRVSEAIPYEERAVRAEPLLMRPVTFLAALYEMRGDLEKAHALLATSAALEGHEQMRREALFMINLARDDRDGLRRLMLERADPPHPLLDDPEVALADLRERYADAALRGVHSPFLSVAIFASFLGDEALSLDALRALGPTQNLHVLWRRTMREVRSSPGFEDLVRDLKLVDYWRASGEWGEFCRQTEGEQFACG